MADALDQAFHDVLVADGFALKIAHHAIIVSLNCSLYHFFMGGCSGFLVLVRNFYLIGAIAVGTIGLHFVKVDNALEAVLLAKRQLQWQHVLAKLTAQIIQYAVKISVFTVHLVDKNDARQACFLCQLPALLGAHLYAAGGTNHD